MPASPAAPDSPSAPRGLYVTGTDTGIGKTHSSCALIRGLRARGRRVLGMKPVASGCEWVDGTWQNADALALRCAASMAASYADINPIALPRPSAPEIAARAAGMQVSLEPIEHAYDRLAANADCVVVEGVGGWLAPLSETITQLDLVQRLNLPVVLVVGLRLGCINHALLSERALRADGVVLLGWIGNAVDAEFPDRDDTVAILRRRLGTPCLGVLPHGSDSDLDIETLVRRARRSG